MLCCLPRPAGRWLGWSRCRTSSRHPSGWLALPQGLPLAHTGTRSPSSQAVLRSVRFESSHYPISLVTLTLSLLNSVLAAMYLGTLFFCYYKLLLCLHCDWSRSCAGCLSLRPLWGAAHGLSWSAHMHPTARRSAAKQWPPRSPELCKSRVTWKHVAEKA